MRISPKPHTHTRNKAYIFPLHDVLDMTTSANWCLSTTIAVQMKENAIMHIQGKTLQVMSMTTSPDRAKVLWSTITYRHTVTIPYSESLLSRIRYNIDNLIDITLWYASIGALTSMWPHTSHSPHLIAHGIMTVMTFWNAFFARTSINLIIWQIAIKHNYKGIASY